MDPYRMAGYVEVFCRLAEAEAALKAALLGAVSASDQELHRLIYGRVEDLRNFYVDIFDRMRAVASETP